VVVWWVGCVALTLVWAVIVWSARIQLPATSTRRG